MNLNKRFTHDTKMSRGHVPRVVGYQVYYITKNTVYTKTKLKVEKPERKFLHPRTRMHVKEGPSLLLAWQGVGVARLQELQVVEG